MLLLCLLMQMEEEVSKFLVTSKVETMLSFEANYLSVKVYYYHFVYNLHASVFGEH